MPTAPLAPDLGGGLAASSSSSAAWTRRSMDSGEVLAARARRADVVVEGQLGAGQALPAGVGEADQVRGGGAQRIDPALLGLEG